MRVLVLLLFLFAPMTSLCQKIDSKYLISIIYLQNDQNLHKTIRDVFKKKVPKRKNITFEITEKVSYMGIESFEFFLNSRIKNSSYDSNNFYKENYFTPFDNPLKDLLPKKNGNVKIHFSKPVQNFIMAELSIEGSELLNLKLGKRIRILFFFNDNGFISETRTETVYYN